MRIDQFMLGTMSKENLTIWVAVSDSILSNDDILKIMISTNSSIEITKNTNFVLNGDNWDGMIEQVVERNFSSYSEVRKMKKYTENNVSNLF